MIYHVLGVVHGYRNTYRVEWVGRAGSKADAREQAEAEAKSKYSFDFRTYEAASIDTM